MKKNLAILNLLSVVVVITINYISQAFRLNNTTIGEISGKYDNLFTPAGYAFSIWGLIYISLLGHSLFQIRRVFFSKKENQFVLQTSYWFTIANILNACWVFAFVYEYTGLSVVIMLGILFSLIQIILKTNMERWDASFSIIASVWWPICLYSGWITVATIANIAAYLTKTEWNGFGISDQVWTLIMILVAVIINLLMIITRNMREFAAIGIWALVAIFIRHQELYQNIAWTALAGAMLLFIAIAVHGYTNRTTNPFSKLKERLNS